MSQNDSHAEHIAASITSDAAAYSPLIASWNRSARLYGLRTGERRVPERLTNGEFSEARQRMDLIIRATTPSMDRLFDAVGGVGCCVLLADTDGISVERRGAVADDTAFADLGLWTATRWSEAIEGTNAIGTCLAEKRPVSVHRDQHYFTRNTELSCMSAPVHDAYGRLAGVLDISSCRTELTAAFSNLIAHTVRETARRIEADAFRLAFPNDRIMMVPGLAREDAAMVAIDKSDMVIGATHAARTALGLEANLHTAPRPATDLLGVEGTETLSAAERALLTRALARQNGNVSATAKALGISRATLYRKLTRLKITAAG